MLLVACMVAVVGWQVAVLQQAQSAQSVGTIVGSLVDSNGGLPIVNARIDLYRGDKKISQTATLADGSFRFGEVLPATYSILIAAPGYQTTSVPTIVVTAGKTAEIRTAIARSAVKEIGTVTINARGSLQTSATINQTVSSQVFQRGNFIRGADVVGTLPGVTASTSNAVGDDVFLSIRGFNPSETATLLDGHQIGPLGSAVNAFNTYDSQVSPFFGIRGIQVTYGSGATGLYGVDTIAGTVDYQTLQPTKRPTGLLQQGVGNDGKMLSALQATGTSGRLGYAIAYAVEGTYGQFAPGEIAQIGLSGNDLTSATLAANTYTVTGDYLLRNDLLKLSYDFEPGTKLTLTGFSSTDWVDKTGNGDQDFLSYPFQLFNAQQALAQNGNMTSVTLPNGTTATCTGAIAVLANTPTNFACLPVKQYAQATAGPAGGGPGPWQGIRSQDYDARFTKSLGTTNTVTIDGYVDHYATDFNRQVASNFFRSHFFFTHGLLITDDIAGTKNDFGFGYSLEHQTITNSQFPDNFTSPGQVLNQIAYLQPFEINDRGFFVNDQYSPNSRLSFFANLWVKHADVTPITSFDPRFSIMYRPTDSDVLRLTAGHSASVPQPGLRFATPSVNGNVGSFFPNCAGNLQSGIGDVPDGNLGPEKATDSEFAYGHRFRNDDSIQLNVYQAWEQGALFDGSLPFSAIGSNTVPQQTIQLYLNKIASICPNIPNPTTANLSVGTTFNAAQARYRGFELSGRYHLTRNFLTDYAYDTQSAAFFGIPDSILQQNVTDINGAQIGGIPLHKISSGLEYQSTYGFDARLDWNYMDNNNSFNAPAFWWTNGTLSQTEGAVTLTLGVNNAFNSAAASRFGRIGLGEFQPENQFGTDTSALSQGSELYGLPARQVMLTVQYRL